MSRARQISVIGAGAADEALAGAAVEVGRRLAEADVVVVCGGHGGVMEAVARGASEAGGTVVGVVPSAEPADANPYCTHVVAAATGIARNLAVVASGESVIAIGGAWGTLSEIAHARQLSRPVIALGSWSLTPPEPLDEGDGITEAPDPEAAVTLALRAADR